MKRYILILMSALILCTLSSYGQDYKSGIGIRAGFSSGLTFKHFISGTKAFEGLLTTRWEGFDLTGLLEWQHRAFQVERLSWFYGGGIHLGFYNGNHVYWGTPGNTYTVVGLDGILGLEYTFRDIPVNIGVDWKPALNLVGYTGLWSEGALSVRYVF